MNDQFRLRCAEIRLRLHEVDKTIEHIQAGPLAMNDGAREKTVDRMDRMDDLISDGLMGVADARARVEAWIDHGRPQADVRVSAWKADARGLDLNARADDVEAYALAVLELAAASARECAHAVLEAVLARSDADRACLSAGRGDAPTHIHPSNRGA